jgi:meso-butanediol dehydrogenase / (S,S)-butanediol dehydrogenase / diacetyl reductase
MMPGNALLQGRRALVTGSGNGIGRSIAVALAREGAVVAVTDLDGKAAAAVAAELGQGHAAFALDVTDEGATAEIMAAASRALDGLDIVCANAGVSNMKPAVDLTVADWDLNMDVNAKGVFLTNREAVKRFRASGTKGVIVNTASLAAKAGAPLLAHYSASKFAVLGWTQALAREVAAEGIRVNCVCPGFVRTSMQDRELVWEAGLRGMTVQAVKHEYVSLTPLGRIEEPEDVADTVVFLASDLARFVTGEALNVTGGVRMD